MHSGRVWKPRATTLDVTGNPLDLNKGSNPANMDGDHVLVGFLEGNTSHPVVLGGLPHPAADVGNAGKPAGQRLRLKLADGDPDFRKHHGSFYGIDDLGNFVIDTTMGWSGALNPDGSEPPPPGAGATGNHRTLLQPGAQAVLSIGGGATTVADGADATATFTVGDGAVSVAIAQALQTFLDSTIKPMFDNHVHTYIAPAIPGSPAPTLSASTSTPPSIWGAMPTSVISTKAKIPNG